MIVMRGLDPRIHVFAKNSVSSRDLIPGPIFYPAQPPQSFATRRDLPYGLPAIKRGAAT